MGEILNVSCDEAGHTGPDLLHKEQRYFAYASVIVDDDEASQIISEARSAFPVQMPELKASKLMSSKQGRRLTRAILEAIRERYSVSVNDKLLALCGWLFEYIFEPVYQRDPRLLYEKNLHRFVAMYAWLWMSDPASDAEAMIKQFQAYMRSRDPLDAPLLFDRPRPPLSDRGDEHPFECVLRFAYGYRDIIIADNATLNSEVPDGGRWILDLSASALWSHLNLWGETGRKLAVNCDMSKPLQANLALFRGDESDPVIRQRRMKGNFERLGWQFSRPIAFVDSRDHSAVQLADLVAGTAVWMINNEWADECEAISNCMAPYIHRHSIMPDFEVIDVNSRSAIVNALILYDLAKRAERHGDPYDGLAALYQAAEVSWVRGEFHELVKANKKRR